MVLDFFLYPPSLDVYFIKNTNKTLKIWNIITIEMICFYLNIFHKSIITAVFNVTWSIILICLFAAQETFLIIIIDVENNCAV